MRLQGMPFHVAQQRAVPRGSTEGRSKRLNRGPFHVAQQRKVFGRGRARVGWESERERERGRERERERERERWRAGKGGWDVGERVHMRERARI